MAFTIKKDITLLNPQEKRKKYFEELKTGFKQTNSGEVKKDKDGKKIPLTEKEKSFRVGFIAAQNDSAKAYKAKHK